MTENNSPREIYVYGDDGEITQTVGPATSEMIAVYSKKNYRFIVGPRMLEMHSNFFVEEGELRRKEQIAIELSKSEIVADGVDAAILSGVPAGASITVSVGNQAYSEISGGGVVEITSDAPAIYTIDIEAPRKIRQRVTVTAK